MTMDDPPPLISNAYRALNVQLHALGRYGLLGDKWAGDVAALIDRAAAASILDYGCGQGSLARALGRPIAEYDPAIAGKDGAPAPADLVVCTDVLEHIEPDLLDNVLDHLRALTGKLLFAVISTRPAAKLLADGRNAHLIVEPASFWHDRLAVRFAIDGWDVRADAVVAILAALPGTGERAADLVTGDDLAVAR